MARSAVALGSLCFGFFLVANPAYFVSCSSSEGDGFKYGEAEMLEVVEQLNETALAVESRSELSGYQGELSDLQVEFQLEQARGDSSEEAARLAPMKAGWIESAHACSSRSFVKEAAACASSSSMPLEGTVRITDGDEIVRTLEVQGGMDVLGTSLGRAEFSLYAESVELSLFLIWTPEGGGTFDRVFVYRDPSLAPLDPEQGGAGGGGS